MACRGHTCNPLFIPFVALGISSLVVHVQRPTFFACLFSFFVFVYDFIFSFFFFIPCFFFSMLRFGLICASVEGRKPVILLHPSSIRKFSFLHHSFIFMQVLLAPFYLRCASIWFIILHFRSLCAL